MAELTLQADDFNFMNYTRINNLDTTCPAKEVDEYGADLNPTPKTWRLKLPQGGILQGVHRHWHTLVVSVQRRKIGQTSCMEQSMEAAVRHWYLCGLYN